MVIMKLHIKNGIGKGLQSQCNLQGLFQVLGLAHLLYPSQIDFDIY